MHAVYNYSGFVDLVVNTRTPRKSAESTESHTPVNPPESVTEPAYRKKTPLPDKPED